MVDVEMAVSMLVARRELGVSSATLCMSMFPTMRSMMFGFTGGRWDAPYDGADLYRCRNMVRATGGEERVHWPETWARAVEYAADWGPILHAWDPLMVALAEDERNQARRKRPFPPAGSYWLLHVLRKQRDPYEGQDPHPFRYDPGPLDRYVCTVCGALGVKLWRAPHDDSSAWCAKCACEQAGLPDDIGADGRRTGEHGESDQVYNDDKGLNLLPYVPSPNGTWGYSSASNAAVWWWRLRPTRLDIRLAPGVSGG